MISENIPDGFKSQLEVVSCYIEHDGEILLLQRHPEHKHSAKWGLPAGKLEEGETTEQAIIREIQEETGLEVGEQRLMFRDTLFVSYLGKEFLYHTFQATFADKPTVRINPPEHKAYGWFTPEQALSLDYIHDLDACIQRHYRDALPSEVIKLPVL